MIGLGTESEFFGKRDNEEMDIGFLVDVNYVDVLPRVRVDKLNLPAQLFYTKQPAWAYECEQRLVRRMSHGHSTSIKDNLGMPVVVFEVPIDAIREIVVGFQAPSVVVEGARKLQLAPEGNRIKLLKFRLSPKSGELERVAI